MPRQTGGSRAWTRDARGRLVRTSAASATNADATNAAATTALALAPAFGEARRLVLAQSLELVLRFLPPLEIIRAQLVCRAWRGAARSPAVWIAADLSLRSTFSKRDDLWKVLPKLAAFAAACGESVPCRHLKLRGEGYGYGELDPVGLDAACVASAAPTLQALHLVHWRDVDHRLPAALQPRDTTLLSFFRRHHFPLLRALTLSGKVDYELASAVLLAAPKLRDLYLEGAELRTDAGAVLLSAPGLRLAHLRAVQLFPPGDDHATHERHCQCKLDMVSATLCALHLSSIKDLGFGTVHLPALHTLKLDSVMACYSANGISDTSLLHITRSSPQLTHLEVSGCARGEAILTPAVLAPLATQCPILEELYLRRSMTEQFAAVFHAPVFTFPRLRVLAARVIGGIVLRCPMLQELHLCGSNLAVVPQHGTAGVLLEGGTSIQALDVSHCSLTAAQLTNLADTMPTLRQLNARKNWLSQAEERKLLRRRTRRPGQPGAGRCVIDCSQPLGLLTVDRDGSILL